MVDDHCSEIIHTTHFTSSSSSSAPSHSELTNVQSTQREANGETQFGPHARRESEPLQMYTQYLEKRRMEIVDCESPRSGMSALERAVGRSLFHTRVD
jgi:hypothetical protein